MVGAKQFAMRRKIIEDKEENPILTRIKMPSVMSGHEDAFKNMGGSLIDKLQKGSEDPKPKIKKVDSKASPMMEISNLMHMFHMMKEMPKIFDKEVVKEKELEIPESLVNRLTCDVFQKIKTYLDSDRDFDNRDRKRINIAIDL